MSEPLHQLVPLGVLTVEEARRFERLNNTEGNPV